PAITSREIGIIVDFAENNVMPVVYVETKSQEHPLCSVVRSNLIEKMEKTLIEGKNAALNFFKSVEHSTVYFNDDRPFTNVNTPEDLRLWETENVI
ncbi:MAG: hypothetical protein NTY09_00320, partial [bacterium]|nr:hypothetical protein [bacterium]